jgi:hypothetical protein
VETAVKSLISVVSMLGRNEAVYITIAAHCVYKHLRFIERREVPLGVFETSIYAGYERTFETPCFQKM